MKRVTAKIGSMRKAQDFVVYPPSGDNSEIKVQSETVFARINVETGKGRYATHPTGANSAHLIIKGKDVTVPLDLVKQFLDAQYKSGDSLGGGVTVV